MELLNYKALAIEFLSAVGDSVSANLLAQNLVSSSNDPSQPQFKVQIWPVQAVLPTIGNKHERAANFIAHNILNYQPMVDAIKDSENANICVFNTFWFADKTAPDTSNQLLLKGSLTDETAVYEASNRAGQILSQGPPIVFDTIKFDTGFGQWHFSGAIITAIPIV